MSAEYWETIKKLDQFTADYINDRISELHIKNFEAYENKTDYGKGADHAYRECFRIFSDIYNHRKMVLKK